jgi:cyclophilin family peptidyl-prolyl cis-trans isomerase
LNPSEIGKSSVNKLLQKPEFNRNQEKWVNRKVDISMPHTSKKYKKQKDTPSGINRTTIAVVALIVIIVAAAGGYYVYSSAQHTTSSTQDTSTQVSSTLTSNASVSTGSDLLYAKIATSQGTFEVELFKNQTPTTVNNFVSLAQSGFYNNLVWHRISKNFVIQTGDPTTKNAQGSPCSWGTGTSKTIPLEIVPSLHNVAGTLAMASPQGGLPSSQFFVNLSDNSASLDGRYTVFGKVISGMNVVDALGALQTTQCPGGTATDGPPAQPSSAMMLSVTIQTSP